MKIAEGYLRTQIENMPEKEKRPLIEYLDRGRAAADEGMRLLFAGKYDDFYKSTSKEFQKNYSPEQFKQIIEIFQKQAGEIFYYEYRNQSIELPPGVELSADLSKATSNVYYFIKVSKVFSDGIFIDIETTVEDGRHKISFLTTTNYGENVPKWLLKQ
ncbi:MAG: hypothetical protein JSS81_07100 [Acidobacteria bacterium]|nr:hypothetical protein [Acidobacteriota bacterium]